MAFYISRFKNIVLKDFDVEIVTPMFLGGANTREAELRAPSIKGMLRFWWRALSVHLSLDNLRKNEAEIFGDAGDRNGKSKVQIKIINTLIYYGKDRENPVPHKKVNFGFPCFNPGEKFSLKIIGDERVFDLFQLVSILGGLGKRSRRGFGSFRITKINGEYFNPASTAEEILALLQNLAKNRFEKTNKEKIIRTDNAHAHYAYIKSIEIGEKPFNNYKEILLKIGQSSHDNNSDYTGYAKGQERFSSPVYVSVTKSGNAFKPIITTLNTAFKMNNQNHGINKSVEFKKDILSGGSR